MNQHGPFRTVLAGLLAVTLPLALAPSAAAGAGASLEGTIFALEDKAPVEGAVLHAGNLRTGELYSSPISDSDGTFSLGDLPPAAYQLAVETEEGLYLVGTTVPLEPGQARDIHLGLRPDATADDPETAEKKEEDEEMGFMNNPLFATLLVVGSSILLGYIITELDDTDTLVASPSTL